DGHARVRGHAEVVRREAGHRVRPRVGLLPAGAGGALRAHALPGHSPGERTGATGDRSVRQAHLDRAGVGDAAGTVVDGPAARHDHDGAGPPTLKPRWRAVRKAVRRYTKR